MNSSTTGADLPGTEFGCTTCLTHFANNETKRVHMKEDWHVYNLKRRVASLPPISAVAFYEQVLRLHVEIDDKARPSSPFQQSCIACEQHYTNRRAWQAHLKSRNHTQKSSEYNEKALFTSHECVSRSIPPSDGFNEGQLDDVTEIFSPLECLFCSFQSSSLDSNLAHMSHEHSFFIPDAEFLIDMESFLSYLFVVVSAFHECLLCGTVRSTKCAVQDHMRGKGHCKVDFDDDEHQLKQFYDFSSDMSDDEEELGEETTLVPDNDELRLPSGKILGSRSRARYFRQNLRERSSPASSSRQQPLTEGESATLPENSMDRRVSVRAGTSTSLIGVPELQQRALIAVEKKILKMETREKNEYQSILERGGNKQKRFRVKSIGKKAGGLEKRLG